MECAAADLEHREHHDHGQHVQRQYDLGPKAARSYSDSDDVANYDLQEHHQQQFRGRRRRSGVDRIDASVNVTNSTFANNTSMAGGRRHLAMLRRCKLPTARSITTWQAGGGGFLQSATGDITILRSTFTKNAATIGEGGAFDAFGIEDTIRITDSKFTFNSATDLGGCFDANQDFVSILRSTFDHNTSTTSLAGAIYNSQDLSAPTTACLLITRPRQRAERSFRRRRYLLAACVFRCNTATNGEGGAFIDDVHAHTDVTITDCTIDGNTAGGNGGGFAAEGVQLTMSGTTVSNNRSGSDGGGAYIATSGLAQNGEGSSIINCTFSGNGAATDGGGIDYEGEGICASSTARSYSTPRSTAAASRRPTAPGLISIGNTIVAKNIATNGPDVYDTQSPFDDSGHNLFFSLLGQGTAGIDDPADPGPVVNADNDLIRFDPKLGPLANNGGPTKTHALAEGQPGDQCRRRFACAADRSARREAPAGTARGYRGVREEITHTENSYCNLETHHVQERTLRRHVVPAGFANSKRWKIAGLLTIFNVTTTADRGESVGRQAFAARSDRFGQCASGP